MYKIRFKRHSIFYTSFGICDKLHWFKNGTSIICEFFLRQ